MWFVIAYYCSLILTFFQVGTVSLGGNSCSSLWSTWQHSKAGKKIFLEVVRFVVRTFITLLLWKSVYLYHVRWALVYNILLCLCHYGWNFWKEASNYNVSSDEEKLNVYNWFNCVFLSRCDRHLILCLSVSQTIISLSNLKRSQLQYAQECRHGQLFWRIE